MSWYVFCSVFGGGLIWVYIKRGWVYLFWFFFYYELVQVYVWKNFFYCFVKINFGDFCLIK